MTGGGTQRAEAIEKRAAIGTESTTEADRGGIKGEFKSWREEETEKFEAERDQLN